MKQIKLHGNTRDLTNQRFGKLVVLYPTEKRDNRSIVWHCQCDCGNTADVSSKNLTYGASQSCGCAYSIGETNIAKVLTENKIQYKKEYCIQINEKRLRFDFAIYENGKVVRLIEFDGPHHKQGAIIYNVNKEHCEKIQQHDQIKNNWAKSHNIPLVRIPYSQRDKITLDTILSDKYLHGVMK